jgi:ketosteroid isomerase-like protein
MFEQWDLAALKELYSEDFEQTEMDDATPPNAPRKRTKGDLVQIFERNQEDSKVKITIDNVKGDRIVRDLAVQARDPE